MNKFERISIAAFALIVASFIFLVWTASALFAQSNALTKQNQCNTISNIVEQIEALPAELRNQMHIRRLDADQTKQWLAAFNAIPPQSNIRMDTLAFIRRDGNDFVVLVFEVDGCVVNAVKLQTEIHFRLLRDSGLELGKVI